MILLLCALGCYLGAVARHDLEFGSLLGKWTYPYVGSVRAGTILRAAALTVLAGMLLKASESLARTAAIAAVLLWATLATPIDLALRWHAPGSLADIITNPVANSFYGPALRLDPWLLLRDAEALAGDLPVHARANMPGKILFFRLLTTITTSPTSIALIIIVLSNLTAVLLYAVAYEIFRSRRTALSAAVFYLFTPARVYFLPILNVVSVLPILVALWTMLRYTRSHSAIGLPLIGGAVYLTLLFDPTPLVTGLIFLGLLAHAATAGHVSVRDCLLLIGTTIASFLAIHASCATLLGYDILRDFKRVIDDAARFNAGNRPYAVWILPNLKEFLINAGVMQSALACALGLIVATGVRQRARGQSVADAALALIRNRTACLTASLFLTLLVLDLSGVNRGEASRLWIFLSAFLQIVAARSMHILLPARALHVLAAGSVVQSAVTIELVGFVLPV